MKKYILNKSHSWTKSELLYLMKVRKLNEEKKLFIQISLN